MPKFLVDVNLPYYFSLWNTDDYVHQVDIDPRMKDKQIWEYAKAKNLIIITKDSDFSNRIMFQEPPPKVIHIRFGNMSMKDFHDIINTIWNEAISMIENYKLVNVYKDKIEGVK